MDKKKWMLVLAFLGFVPPVFAQGFSDYATVIRVEPRYGRVSAPTQECWSETVSSTREEPRSGNVAGTLIGGVAGAVLGHQIGGGRGRDVATVGGALAGALLGNQVGDRGQPNYRTSDELVRRCATREGWSERIVGYMVTAVYNGRELNFQTRERPGPSVRVDVTVPYQSL